MVAFFDWFIRRDTLALLWLLEAADYFDPQSFNPVFRQQLDALLDRITDSEARRQISQLRTFDFGNYVSRSLRRAGFRNEAEEEAFQQVIFKLLVVSPGRLFKGWEPGKHGPLERRFRAATWNAIRNIAEKTRNRRKWMTTADPVVMADRYAGKAPYSDLIDQFRQLVAERLGKLAAAILDAKLSGEDVNKMIGKAEYGTPSAFYVKKETRAIKQLAHQFAQQTGDLAFLNMVNRALSAERQTVEKRKAARQAQ